MRILLIYPGHSHSTFDVARGYEKALRALGEDVRAYNYHAALGFYHGALDHWRGRNPGFAPDNNAHLLLASEHAVIEAVDFVPDAVLIVNAFALHRRVFDLLHRLRLPLVLLLTESPYRDEIQAVIMGKGHIAAAFTNDRASVEPLERESGVETAYLPHAYDPEVHRVFGVDGDCRSDVFFHGTLWPERKTLFEGLSGLGPGVRIGGPDPAAVGVEEADRVLANTWDNAELARWYNGTKIAINHHRTFVGTDDGGQSLHIQGREAESLGPRAYEIAACGAFQLCDDTRPELREVFGDSVATYKDREELFWKAAYYLAHDGERRAMAEEARKRVRDCTFEERARSIILPTIEEVI